MKLDMGLSTIYGERNTMLTPRKIAERTKSLGSTYFTFADEGPEGHYEGFLAAEEFGLTFFPSIKIPASCNGMIVITAITHQAYLSMMNSEVDTVKAINSNPLKNDFIYGLIDTDESIDAENVFRLVPVTGKSCITINDNKEIWTNWKVNAEESPNTTYPILYTSMAQMTEINSVSEWMTFQRITTGTDTFVDTISWMYSYDEASVFKLNTNYHKTTERLESAIANGTTPHMIKAKPLNNDEETLRQLVEDGWNRLRKGTSLADESLQRIKKEMSVICSKNFTEYFINVYKFITTEKELGILIGPGRGSATGSEILYLLGISSCDPLKYGLFFERFLNEGRNNMPDIDWDSASICIGSHGELIDEHNKKRRMNRKEKE